MIDTFITVCDVSMFPASSPRKTQIARELHTRDVAEAEGGGGGHTEQHIHQVQSGRALPGITPHWEEAHAFTDVQSVWFRGLLLRLWRTSAPTRYPPSFTNSWGPYVKTTSRLRSISSENILHAFCLSLGSAGLFVWFDPNSSLILFIRTLLTVCCSWRKLTSAGRTTAGKWLVSVVCSPPSQIRSLLGGTPAPYKHQCLLLMVCYVFTDNDKEYFFIFGSHLCSTKLHAAVNLVSPDYCLLV